MRGATWSHSRGIGEALANKLDRDTDREQESEGECESSEKELGNPRAGSVEDFGTRCIVPHVACIQGLRRSTVLFFNLLGPPTY